MAIKQIFKVSFKTFFNPSGWLGTKELIAYQHVFFTYLKNLFTPAKPQFHETFDEALTRLNVTEADLKKNETYYLIYYFIFITLSALGILTAFYYLFHHHTIAGFILCLSVSILFAAHAFRFHFWRYQIKKRRLGSTFKDWLEDILGKPKGSTQ